MKLRSAFLATSAAALLLTSGCQIVPDAKPDPTRFYVLSNPDTADYVPGEVSGITLGLSEIRLPRYLADSRAMAVRNSANGITYRDFDRWAEPLDEGSKRVLRVALTTSPRIARVLTLPFPAGVERDYDLQITVLAAEGMESGTIQQVQLALDYTISTPAGELVTHGIYRAPTREWDGTSAELARLLSLAIGASAEPIAQALP